MKRRRRKQVVGYLFGFKEQSTKIENGKQVICVSMKQSTSTTYPTEYCGNKDFWCKAYYLGDKSDLFIDPKKFIDSAKSILPICMQQKQDDYVSEHLSDGVEKFSEAEFRCFSMFGTKMLYHGLRHEVFESNEQQQQCLFDLYMLVKQHLQESLKTNLEATNALQVQHRYQQYLEASTTAYYKHLDDLLI